MAGNNLLLDTNIAIAFLSGDRAVVERVAAAETAHVSVVSFGELYYGAAKSARSADNRERVDQLATRIGVLPCDLVTAQRYGQIKSQLRAAGRPIPENDLWIAAQAIQHGLTLLSRDRHFQAVPLLNGEPI